MELGVSCTLLELESRPFRGLCQGGISNLGHSPIVQLQNGAGVRGKLRHAACGALSSTWEQKHRNVVQLIPYEC